jgi:hypothetical protein
MKKPCNEEQAFICERDINQHSIPLTVRCGNTQSTIVSSTETTMPTTQMTTIAFIPREDIPSKNVSVTQLSSTIHNKLQKTKTNTIDPSMNIINLLININKIF